MNTYEGRLLNLGTIDKCNRTFAKDCNIEFPEKVPVIYNFQNGVDKVLGYAEISKDDDGLRCKVTMDNDEFTGSEYYVGGYYIGVKKHKENDIDVIDACKLVSMSIVPDIDCRDEKIKIWKLED